MSFGEVYDRVLKEYPDILTVEEMSSALGISTKTGYQLLREDKIDHLGSVHISASTMRAKKTKAKKIISSLS